MAVLVYAEHDNASLKDATLAVVTAAAQLGEVHVLVAGHNCDAAAQAAAKVAGVAKVHVADDAAFANQLAENVAPLVAGLMGHHDAVLFPATAHGKNIAPRVAAHLDVMQISDILSVESADTFTRPIYAGNAIATVQSTDAKKVITVRGTAFAKAEADRRFGCGRSGQRCRRCRHLQLCRQRNCQAGTPRTDQRQRSSSLADVRSKTDQPLKRPSSRWRINSVPPSAHRALRSMQAMSPMTIKSAKPARSSRQKSMSPSASAARSSIWRA